MLSLNQQVAHESQLEKYDTNGENRELIICTYKHIQARTQTHINTHTVIYYLCPSQTVSGYLHLGLQVTVVVFKRLLCAELLQRLKVIRSHIIKLKDNPTATNLGRLRLFTGHHL